MNIYRYMSSLLFVMLAFMLAGCNGEPVFTEMSTNRLKIVIKGTLESETPANWDSVFNTTVDNPTTSGYVDDSVDDYNVITSDFFPDNFMFDISEIKLNGKAIGNYRQVFSIPLSDATPFFNGTGITLKNDDPGNGSYSSIQFYIRKMIFDNASIYSFEGSSWNSTPELAQVIFHENEVEGFNFNNLQVNSYWDSLRDNASSTLRIYPLEIPIIGGMNYDRNNDQTVLEIRIVIKNFIKMYEYDYYEDGIFKVCHFYGLSDWLRDVRADEHDMGRNIHAVARAYVPGMTGTITGTTPTSGYVIVIPDGEQISDYYRTSAGDALRNVAAVSNCDFPMAPVYSGAHIESVLDYYCNYEEYKSLWNAKLLTCPDYTTYTSAWEGYEASVEDFKIAPYITIANGSGYTLNNVAPGSYTVWSHAVPATNNLFVGAWAQIGSTVDINAGDTKTP